MFVDYPDIISRIQESPKWWLYGVPRYCDFTPDAATVYGKEVLLVKAACQSCRSIYEIAISGPGSIHTFRDGIEHYADVAVYDPPNACCSVGAAMMAEPLKVLEFWERKNAMEWKRVQKYECWLDGARHSSDEWRDAAEKDGGVKCYSDYFLSNDLYEEWSDAWKKMDSDKLATLYERAGCERVNELISNDFARRELSKSGVSREFGY